MSVIITDKVAALTDRSILLEQFRHPFARHDNQWIPKSAVADCDAELDDLEVGEEITIEIHDWKARELGIAE